MADGTTTPPAAATGRVTHSTAQAAASTSSASHDTAEYLRLSRFADYVTAAWQDRYATINQHSTTLDIDNKLAYLYNHYVEHGKTHEMLRRKFCEDCDSRVLDYSHLGKGKFPPAPRNARRCDLLEVNAINVGKGSESKMAENLHRVVSRYMCDDDGDIEQPKGSKADLHFNEQGDLVRY